ncbi:hypothetical protein AOLI_G00297080 [Acnodon oligacanthus]
MLARLQRRCCQDQAAERDSPDAEATRNSPGWVTKGLTCTLLGALTPPALQRPDRCRDVTRPHGSQKQARSWQTVLNTNLVKKRHGPRLPRDAQRMSCGSQ